MSDNFRYRHGDTKPIMSPAVDTAAVVEIGDLVSETPEAAADTTWDTNIATTQEAFHDVFLGVAEQRSRAGDTDPIRVATSGVFEFDCASATFAVGDLVGTAKQTGNGIESQKVVAVATPSLAIGRVVEAGASITKVKVEIDSTIVTGGPRAAA